MRQRRLGYSPDQLAERTKRFHVWKVLPEGLVSDLSTFDPETLSYIALPDRFSSHLPYLAYIRLTCIGMPESDGPYMHPILEVKLYRRAAEPGVTAILSRYFDPRPEMTSPESYVPLQAYVRAAERVLGMGEDERVPATVLWNPAQPTHATAVLTLETDITWDNPTVHIGHVFLELALDIEDEYRALFREHVVGDRAAVRGLLHELRELPQGFADDMLRIQGVALGPRLGHGGTAVVFAGEREGRAIVMKALLPDVRFEDIKRIELRFDKEVSIVKLLSGSGATPNFIVAGAVSGVRYLIMERVFGETLYQMLHSGLGDEPLESRASLVRQVAGAVYRLQSRDVVHRDLSPKNVMVRPDGSACVIDFGTATLVGPPDQDASPGSASGQALTLPQDQMGSLKYAAPEVRDDPRAASLLSDIFSLGIIGYELLLGRNIAGNLPQLHEVMGVDIDLSRFLHAAVDWNPKRRPSIEDLRRISQAGMLDEG